MKFLAIFALMALNCHAVTLKSVSIRYYNCSIFTVSKNLGKCAVSVVSEGKEMDLVASPEVAAPWGNSYGDITCRPMTDLSMEIDEANEIVSVKDLHGKTISTKFDYSR